MASTAAIVTVGSELVEGLRLDTNTAEIARALAPRGFAVVEALSVGDDPDLLARVLARLVAETCARGGDRRAGPTHDDITRDAASAALGLPLAVHEPTARFLDAAVARHRDPEAAAQVHTQALVLEGADVIAPTTGTAPGQVSSSAGRGELVLLPGPPSEMRPMLEVALARYPLVRALPHELGAVGLSESDAQVLAQRALAAHPDIVLTVLARPGDVRVLLFDDGAGANALARGARAVAEALGTHCYTVEGDDAGRGGPAPRASAGSTIATAESCTGGMVAAALTDVAGSSASFLGGVVAYDNRAKEALLGVDHALLDAHGAVSEEAARAMAEGARERLGADIVVAVTGIAGPEGGTDSKPVGLVWFAVATRTGDDGRGAALPADLARGRPHARHGDSARSRALARCSGDRESVRCFVGIPLADSLAASLATACEAIRREAPAWRDEKWVAAENYHVTVRFLGEIADDSADQLLSVLETVAETDPRLRARPGRCTRRPERASRPDALGDLRRPHRQMRRHSRAGSMRRRRRSAWRPRHDRTRHTPRCAAPAGRTGSTTPPNRRPRVRSRMPRPRCQCRVLACSRAG